MTSHETFTVRRAAIGDEPILRALRLQAMLDSPDAFGSTYERELARTPLDWQRWLSPGATDALVGAVIAWAATERAAVIRLTVIKSNAQARRCYERNGFTLTGHEATRERDGRIELRMERPVPATC